MERLEAKRIHGRTYYYYSKWAWVDGRCRRVWQKYLGKLENILEAVEGGGPAPQYAELFQWGLPQALWRESCRAQVVDVSDQLCPKRQQGLSTGQYLAIAAMNRAIRSHSKRSMWEWFSQTVLLRHLPGASPSALSSQRFWDHMGKIDRQACRKIWKGILKGVVRREGIDLSHICYDGTNFYTFIGTFNSRCTVAKRGKNKQGRSNLRQISYALFCGADGHLPLYYDVYEGNRHDAKEFPLMLRRFEGFFKELSSRQAPPTTLIFDKGNNGPGNFSLLDSMGLNYVGSVKLNEHKDLAQFDNQDSAWVPCPEDLPGTKSFRVHKRVYDRDRVLVLTYNRNLFNAQWLTLQQDIAQATERLASLQGKLEDRISGVLKRGKVPSQESVHRQCQKILSRQYLKRIIPFTLSQGPGKLPRLEYQIDEDAVHELSQTYLGKTILITNRQDWDDAQIIRAYRSQFLIEDVFQQMKDRQWGSWWPLHHWTDSKIQVHGLYCTIALLLRALLYRRIQQAGVHLPMKRILSELDAIREVVNVYPRKRGQRKQRSQSVFTKTSELQEQLLSILELKGGNQAF